MTKTKSTKTTAGHYLAAMKNRLIFDSHEYVKRMTGGGFNEQQAEVLAAEHADLLNNLATRQDIETVKDDLEVVNKEIDMVKKNMVTKDDLENMATKQDIELVRQEIVVSAQTLKVEMIKWMIWYFLSGLAVMLAVLKLT